MRGSARCLDCRRSVDSPRGGPPSCRCGISRKEIRADAGRDPVTGRRRQISRTVRLGKRETETELANLISELSTDEYTLSSTASFGRLMEAWIRQVETRGRAAGTVKNYKQHAIAVRSPVKAILAGCDAGSIGDLFDVWPDYDATFVLGDVSLHHLSTDDLDFFYACLITAGRQPATIARYHASIRGALNFGLARRWIHHNPALATTRPSVPRPKITVPTPEQVRAIITSASDRRPVHGVYLQLAAATWARRGELTALRRSAINWQLNEILIAHSLSRHEGMKDTKSHGSRRITVDRATMHMLAEHLDGMEQAAQAAGIAFPADPFLFSDECGHAPWHADTPSRFFEDAAKAAGVENVRLHDFRHFGATQAIAAGVPITTVSYRLGHSKVTTTLDVYAHWIPATDHLASDLMSRLLTAPPALAGPGSLSPPTGTVERVFERERR